MASVGTRACAVLVFEPGNFDVPPSLIPGHHRQWCFDPGIVARVALGLHSEKAFVFTPTKIGRAVDGVALYSLVQGSLGGVFPNSEQVEIKVITKLGQFR